MAGSTNPVYLSIAPPSTHLDLLVQLPQSRPRWECGNGGSQSRGCGGGGSWHLRAFNAECPDHHRAQYTPSGLVVLEHGRNGDGTVNEDTAMPWCIFRRLYVRDTSGTLVSGCPISSLSLVETRPWSLRITAMPLLYCMHHSLCLPADLVSATMELGNYRSR